MFPLASKVEKMKKDDDSSVPLTTLLKTILLIFRERGRGDVSMRAQHGSVASCFASEQMLSG